jgi:hypothetical protein
MKANSKPAPERANCLNGLTALVPQDAEGQTRYPVILDLLLPRWRGNTMTRQAGRLSIRVEGAGFRVTLDCPTEGLLTHIHVASLADLLKTVEDHVSKGRANWQPNYETQKRGRPVIDDVL